MCFCSLLPRLTLLLSFLDILHCLPRAVGVPVESALNLVSRMSPCGPHDTHACCARSDDAHASTCTHTRTHIHTHTHTHTHTYSHATTHIFAHIHNRSRGSRMCCIASMCVFHGIPICACVHACVCLLLCVVLLCVCTCMRVCACACVCIVTPSTASVSIMSPTWTHGTDKIEG